MTRVTGTGGLRPVLPPPIIFRERFCARLRRFLSGNDRLLTPGIWTLHLRFRSQACGVGGSGQAKEKSARPETIREQQLRWCPGPESNRHSRKAEGF